MAGKKEGNSGLTRREFLKVSGVATAALSLAGIAGAGYANGKDFDTYTGWEDVYEGTSQYFNRKPFEVDKPTYELAGPSRRPHTNTEVIFNRHAYLKSVRAGTDTTPGWKPEDGVDALPDDLAAFYKEFPHKLELDLYRQDTLEPIQKENSQKYGLRWELATAWATGIGAIRPPTPDTPPEEWDFPRHASNTARTPKARKRRLP